MKYGLHPSRVSVTVRHCYSFVLGLVFGLICFGPVYVEHVVELHHVRILTLQGDDVLICSGGNVLRALVYCVSKSGANVSQPYM